MKKLNSLLLMALAAVMSLSFTSCDDDANTAYYLDGTWRGRMYVKSYHSGQTYTSTYSVITFNAGYNSGDGYWVDYYKNGHWGSRDYVANHIYWKVRDRNIYIHFVEENTDAVIYNYALGSDYFSGQLETGGDYANIHLSKDTYDDWDDLDYIGYSSTSSTPVEGTMTRATEAKDSTKLIRWFEK